MRAKYFGIFILCIVLLLGMVACGGSKVAPNGMTGAEILEMSQTSSVNTSQFSAIVQVAIMGETMNMTMVGAFDEVGHEMYMVMTEPGISDEDMQIYMVGDWIYATNSSGEWMKTELTNEIWEKEFVVGQQLGLLEGFSDAKYLGMENIGGVNCYKIDVDPNWDAILSATNMSEVEGFTKEEIIDMIKDTSCIVWTAENSYYPMQIFFSMTIDAQYLGDVAMDTTMTFSSINQPVVIDLSSEAQNATEISYEDFIAGGY